MKDLNLRPETLKLLAENKGSMLLDITLGNDFWIWHQEQKQNQT